MKVRVVRNDQLAEGEPTPGMTRREAWASDGMWAGLVHTEPGMVSGWHHHGDYESSIYILSGGLRMEFGPAGREALDAGPGDFVIVPPHAVHREANPTTDRADIIVFRAGHGPPVINTEGPEPA